MGLQHFHILVTIFFSFILWKCQASELNALNQIASVGLQKNCQSKDYEMTSSDDVDMIDRMAYYLHMVYKTERERKNFKCTYCYDFKTKLKLSRGYDVSSKDGNLQERMLYVVNDFAKEVVLAFRGDISSPTYRFSQRIHYLDGVGVTLNWEALKDKDIQVNSVAAEKFEILYPVIQSTLKDIIHEHPGYQVVITGHSYGGALAILTAINGSYAEWFPSLVKVVALQPARLSGNVLMKELKSQKIRVLTVIDNNDEVSRWPVKKEWTYLGELHRIVHPYIFHCKKGIFTNECQDLYFGVDVNLLQNGKELSKIIEVHANYRDMKNFFFKLSDLLNFFEMGIALGAQIGSAIFSPFFAGHSFHQDRKTLQSAWTSHFFHLNATNQ